MKKATRLRGYDLVMFTYDEGGYIEPGLVFFQVKATESLQTIGVGQVFDLDIRDYNLWMMERAPVILIRFDASRKRAYWVAVQNYFRQNETLQPKKGAKSVRVRLSKRQVMSKSAIELIRQIKQETQGPVLGVQT